jgi:protein phosphatase
MRERLAVALERPPAPESTRSQVFRRADGRLGVVAPVLGEPRARVEDLFTVGAADRGHHLRVASAHPWAADAVRGARSGPQENGLFARPPGLWALIDAQSPWARAGAVIPLVERIVAEAPSGLEDLLEHVLAQPWEQFGSGSMVAAEVGVEGVQLAWIGEARAYAVSVGGLRLLTRDHAPEAGLEGDAPDSVAAPVLVRMLGIGTRTGAAFERRQVELEAGERLLLCTSSLGMHLDDAVITTSVAGASPHDGVAALLAAYESTGAGSDAACVLVDPVMAAAPEAP